MNLPLDSREAEVTTREDNIVALGLVKTHYYQHNRLLITADKHDENIKNCVRALIVNQNAEKDEVIEKYMKSSILTSLGKLEEIVKTGLETINNDTPAHNGYTLCEKLDSDLVLDDILKNKIYKSIEAISCYADCDAILLGNKYLGEIRAAGLILETIIKTYESRI
jgi:hypothetical protein